MKIITAISVFLAAAIGLPATAALADEASAKCIQSGLSALGYDVGAVDGQIGNGTRNALSRYWAEVEGVPQVDLADDNMTEWCLFLASREDVDDATRELAAPMEAGATVRIRVLVDPSALDSVVLMGPDNDTLAVTGEFERVGDDANPELIASFPYAEVKDATAVCAGFADGYPRRPGTCGIVHMAGVGQAEPVHGGWPNLAIQGRDRQG